MSTADTPLEEILDRGYRALLRELGPAGFIQFIQHFGNGTGDYTAERHQWLTASVDEIFDAMESKSNRPDVGQ